MRALKCPLIYDVVFWNRHIMACPKCGTKLEGSFKFCHECGFKLSALTEKSTQGRCHIITVKIILTLVQGVHLWYHRWIFNRWEKKNFCQIHRCLIYVTNQAIMVKQMAPHQHIQFQPLLRRKTKRKIKTMLLKKALLKYRWQG